MERSRMRSASVVFGIVGALGMIVGLASSMTTSKRFHPTQVTVDLTHADQKSFLEGPWEIHPDHRFPGVMSARDRGQPVSVMVSLPAVQNYEGRLKFKFHAKDQVIDVRMNTALLTTIRPTNIGKAEKVTLRIPARAVTAGTNRIGFVNHGSPGGTEYELVRLQNYRAPLKKQRAYLIPAERDDRTITAPALGKAAVVGLMVALLMGIVVRGGAWLIQSLGVNRDAAMTLELLACSPLICLGGVALVPWIVPYRIVMTAAFFWSVAAILLLVGHLAVIVPAIGAAGIRRLGDVDLAAGVRRSAQGVGQAVGPQGIGHLATQGKRFQQTAWQAIVQGTRGGFQGCRIGLVGLRWVIVILWRCCRWCVGTFWQWFMRHQYPQGYAKMFCGLAALALASHWIFRWDRTAEWLGYGAGLALVIAVIWESLVSLKEEE